MKKQPPVNVINFTWGSLPVDALDQQTMKLLRIIADRQGTTIEEVISEALDFVIGRRELEHLAEKKVVRFNRSQNSR